MKRCRHYRSWLSATHEWCYECGAFRRMRLVRDNVVRPASVWVRPVGPGGKNPYERFRKSLERFAPTDTDGGEG